METIRVLIVEDSPLVAQVIETVLEEDLEIEVVGIARNGKEAVDLALRVKPDIITMDIVMPVMDGVEATKQIMSYSPTPILILSSSVFEKKMDFVFKAMAYGALDVMDKKAFELGAGVEFGAKFEFVSKIKFLSKIKVVTHPMAKMEKLSRDYREKAQHGKGEDKIVGIVASVGGTEAIKTILQRLPGGFASPILIVQHITPGFVEGFVDWLGKSVSLKVKLAGDGEAVKSGCVYVAPDGVHMEVSRDGKIVLGKKDKATKYVPSGTVLLESLAEAYGDRTIGVILTGMGDDGVDGIEKIYKKGGYTIAQDEKSCVVYGMPKVAVEKRVVNEVVALDEIAGRIIKQTS